MSDIERYRTADSLQAVSTGELSLTADGYRKNGMKPAEKPKAGKSRLQQAVSAQTETVYSFEGTFRDSVRHTVSGSLFRRDALKYISVNEKRFDLCGRIDDSDKFTGSPESRDSLPYAEHIIPKRFRFIKRGVKERRQETVPRSPHTRIEGGGVCDGKKITSGNGNATGDRSTFRPAQRRTGRERNFRDGEKSGGIKTAD